MSRTLCIDFDDTICGPDGDPLGDVRDVLRRFRAKGCRIVISSARLDPGLWGDQLHFRVDEIRRWLDEHGIPFDDVVVHKPSADIYVDDKGFRFDGDWTATEDDIGRLLGL